VHFVLGGKSSVVSASDQTRLQEVAARHPWVSVSVLPEAGHWLHVDQLPALVGVFAEGLARD
jgi:hypothetical protein